MCLKFYPVGLAIHPPGGLRPKVSTEGKYFIRERERELNVKIFSAGRVDCMKLLLSAGADVDSLDAKVDKTDKSLVLTQHC